MIISGTLAIIATTTTLFGLVNSGVNVAGAVHDQTMINESLQNMQQTQQLLQQKAQSTTGANKQEMLIAANKLKQVNSRMSELNAQAYTSALRNEAAGLAKGLVAGVGGVGKLGEVASNAVGIGETAADQVIGNKSLSNTLGNAEMDRWQSATEAGDALDVQILILQARELAKKTKDLNKDMQTMKDWYENEKPGNTDSSAIDQMAVNLITDNPDLAIEPILAVDLAETSEDQNEQSDPRSGVGLDFLKKYDFNGYDVPVKMSYDILGTDDPSAASFTKRDYKSLNSEQITWDTYGKDHTNLDITLTINKGNTVTGKIIGNRAGADYDLNFEGTFNPKDQTFSGKLTGKLRSRNSKPYLTADEFKKDRGTFDGVYKPSQYADEYFTFHGEVDPKNKKVWGYFCVVDWMFMEGTY